MSDAKRSPTPRPWKFYFREGTRYESVGLWNSAHPVLHANAEVHGDGDQDLFIDGYPADFEYIERACNSHDALVEACKRVLKIPGGIDPRVRKGCEDALAAAKETA